MSLPTNFSKEPGEGLHRYFRNLCIEFKKIAHSVTDKEALKEMLERFVHTAKEMDWHHKNTGVYHKAAGDKAVGKVISECKRFIEKLELKAIEANPKDLLEALTEVQELIERLEVW